jgi:hypothetical protein
VARRRGAARGAWLALAGVHALLWLDILLNARHRLHDLVNQALHAMHWYESRVWLQVGLLAALVALAAIAWRARRRTGAALSATAVLLAMWLLEAISWHESDRVLYAQVGPLLLIAYAWIACAAVVVVTALRR